jgi:TolA-binding protein
LALALWSGGLAWAQDSDTDRAYAGAVKLFQGGWYEQAERELGAFAERSTNAVQRTDAILLQAQSRFQLKEYDGVIKLLESRMPLAGSVKDQFLYWLGQAQLELDQFEAAAGSFAELLDSCPNSPLRLEASYSEALARLKTGDTAQTVELLKAPTSPYQVAAQGSTNQDLLVRGGFLLAEALLAQKNFPAMEQTLTGLAKRGLSLEAEWQRQYLLARIEMGYGRGEAALQRATNLVTMPAARTNTLLMARSLTLKGEILEDRQPDAAADAYEEIARMENVGADQKRQALLKLVELAVAQNRFNNAIERLDRFIKQNPADPALNLLRFTLGEVYLRQFYALTSAASPGSTIAPASPAITNALALARAQLGPLAGDTNNPFAGKAYLDLGWSYLDEGQWFGDTNRLISSQTAFQHAVALLPRSLDHAQARFKLADVQFQLRDYGSALMNYRALVEECTDLPEAKEKLGDQALYQLTLASIEAGDLAGAQVAVQQILADFPDSPWSDKTLFLYAQALGNAGRFRDSQQALSEFERRFPGSPMLPEVRLVFARNLLRQADWTAAIQQYSQWLNEFTNNGARPLAEFDRAWCYSQEGNPTNAFLLFTNLVQRYPASSSTPLAQLWLGDYYLNQRLYGQAEFHYQLLFKSTNAMPAPLSRQGMLMAAKAAFFRQGYSDARGYLTNLVDDPKLGPEALVMLGDIELTTSTNQLNRFGEAINFFQRATQLEPNGHIAPLAMGKIANCHFQLAAQMTNRYELATNTYWQVISSPLADVSTRSQAQVALGVVLEKMGEVWTNRIDLLNAALVQYLDVVYARRVQLDKGESPDAYWVYTAAVAAGKLAVDRLNEFDAAERLYQSMMQVLPSFRSDWERRLESLRRQRAAR